MSSHFLTRLVSRLLGLAQVSWATARVGVHRLSHFTFHISLFFHSLFTTYHWFSFVFVLYDQRYVIDPSLADGEFPGLGMALVSMLWSHRRSVGCAWSRNLVLNFCPVRSLNLGPRSPQAANVTTRLRRTPSVYNLKLKISKALLLTQWRSFDYSEQNKLLLMPSK